MYWCTDSIFNAGASSSFFFFKTPMFSTVPSNGMIFSVWTFLWILNLDFRLFFLAQFLYFYVPHRLQFHGKVLPLFFFLFFSSWGGRQKFNRIINEHCKDSSVQGNHQICQHTQNPNCFVCIKLVSHVYFWTHLGQFSTLIHFTVNSDFFFWETMSFIYPMKIFAQDPLKQSQITLKSVCKSWRSEEKPKRLNHNLWSCHLARSE